MSPMNHSHPAFCAILLSCSVVAQSPSILQTNKDGDNVAGNKNVTTINQKIDQTIHKTIVNNYNKFISAPEDRDLVNLAMDLVVDQPKGLDATVQARFKRLDSLCYVSASKDAYVKNKEFISYEVRYIFSRVGSQLSARIDSLKQAFDQGRRDWSEHLLDSIAHSSSSDMNELVGYVAEQVRLSYDSTGLRIDETWSDLATFLTVAVKVRMEETTSSIELEHLLKLRSEVGWEPILSGLRADFDSCSAYVGDLLLEGYKNYLLKGKLSKRGERKDVEEVYAFVLLVADDADMQPLMAMAQTSLLQRGVMVCDTEWLLKTKYWQFNRKGVLWNLPFRTLKSDLAMLKIMSPVAGQPFVASGPVYNKRRDRLKNFQSKFKMVAQAFGFGSTEGTVLSDPILTGFKVIPSCPRLDYIYQSLNAPPDGK